MGAALALCLGGFVFIIIPDLGRISDQFLKKQKLNAEDMADLIQIYAVSFSLEELNIKASKEPHWEQLKYELNALGNFEEHRND